MAPLCAAAGIGSGAPLTLVTGRVIHVATAAQLKAAIHDEVNHNGGPATILLSNGVYNLAGGYNYLWIAPRARDLIIRSVSGNRDAVAVRGTSGGYGADVEHCFMVAASNVTIADMTIGYCKYHGIQAMGHAPYNVAGLRVHNCHFINCNEQHIKGTSASDDPIGVTDGRVQYCTFAFTNKFAYQYYTGGIDVHKGINWHVSDNLFRNIRSPSGSVAEHAIHFWNVAPVSQLITCERNIIINCDRGIGYGLSSAAGGFAGPGTIRNNVIYNDGRGLYDDVGIGLEHASMVTVVHNTVWLESYWAAIEYRFAGTSNGVIANNLVNKQIAQRDGGSALVTNNTTAALAAWFVHLAAGDLHLLDSATAVIDHAISSGGVTDDIDGDNRPHGSAPDIGADEVIPEPCFIRHAVLIAIGIFCRLKTIRRTTCG